MPLLIPLIAGTAGFVGGLWTSNTVSKVTTLVVVGGAGYLLYKHVIKDS